MRAATNRGKEKCKVGKGTNYEKKPTLLDGLVLAGRLLKHTRDIIRNENVFDPQRDFQNRLLVKIYDTALDVNSKAYVANELRVGDNPRIASERLALQAFAIASCESLLGLLADAKVAFGLKGPKFRYWASLAKDTLAKLRAWHDGDRRRYGKIAASCAQEGVPKPEGRGEDGVRLESSVGG